MSFSAIMNIVLLLLSKQEEIMKVVTQAIALFNQIKVLFPALGDIIAGLPIPGTEPEPMSVKWLQESLNKLINAGLVVDGNMGAATMAAIKKFQEAHGLTPDGWAGVLTQAAIVKALQELG